MTIPRFTVAARALRQFGAELITSDEVALHELVKNAFDAKSPRVRIGISSPADSQDVQSIVERLERGTLTIELARMEIAVALESSLDATRRQGLISQFFDATPSADQLAQRLRHFLQNDFWIEVSDTGHGMTHSQMLTDFLTIGTPNKWVKKRGTTGLALLGEKGIGRLSMMRLAHHATVTSKSSNDADWHRVRFDWTQFDDPDKRLDEIDLELTVQRDDVPQQASGTVIRLTRLASAWTTTKLDRFVHRYLRRLQDPFVTSTRPYPIDVYFNGVRQPIPSMYAWFQLASQFTARIEFVPSDQGTSVALRRTIRWRNATSDELREWTVDALKSELSIAPSTFERLGPFTAEVLWFNRQLLNSADIDHSSLEIKKELDIWCGGFAIYRDGFRIGQTGGMEDDWLEMDQKALRSQGYTLNRYQTVGSLRINSSENPHLVDAANRESLVNCDEFKVLRDILADVVVKDLRSHIGTVQAATAKATIEKDAGEQSIKKIEHDFRKVVRDVDELVKQLPTVESRTKGADVRGALAEIGESVKIVRKAVEMAEETRVELLELAGVGLVVEIVIHELSRLTRRTTELLGELGSEADPARIGSVIDNLRSQIRATNKRIRTVDALSPSGRNHKEEFDVVAFVDAILSGYEARFKRHAIVATLSVDGQPSRKPWNVHLVRGLVAQVLENLIANSVYWLQQGLKSGAEQRHLSIELDTRAKTITVSDNGPGIDPRHRTDVFRPYFSHKKKGKGLGLYIAGELASYHKGGLFLDGDADEDGRLRHFVLELPKS